VFVFAKIATFRQTAKLSAGFCYGFVDKQKKRVTMSAEANTVTLSFMPLSREGVEC
jgi:hypothetical protein